LFEVRQFRQADNDVTVTVFRNTVYDIHQPILQPTDVKTVNDMRDKWWL